MASAEAAYHTEVVIARDEGAEPRKPLRVLINCHIILSASLFSWCATLTVELGNDEHEEKISINGAAQDMKCYVTQLDVKNTEEASLASQQKQRTESSLILQPFTASIKVLQYKNSVMTQLIHLHLLLISLSYRCDESQS